MRVIGERIADRCDPGDAGNAVGIESRDQIAARGVVARRARGGNADLGLAHNACSVPSGELSTSVGAAVVDHDDLVGRVGLHRERVEAPLEVATVVSHGNDDGDALSGE